MKIEINLKDMIVFLLIFALAAFCISLHFKLETIKLSEQVRINTQSIQNIATFLNQQAKPVGQSERKMEGEKK
jgi:hypothetical protein